MDSELKQYLEAMEGRLNKRLSKLEDRLAKPDQRPSRHEIVFPRFEAQMRETQAALLRAFAEASDDRTIRFRLLKDDQPGLDSPRN